MNACRPIPHVRVHQAGRSDGSDELALPFSAFEGYPRWSPQTGEPPISLTEALKIAEDHYGKKPEGRRIVILNIWLQRAWDQRFNPGDRPHDPAVWYYTIMGAFLDSISSLYGFTLILLMDRTVHEPTLIPWDQRGSVSPSPA